MKRRAWNSTLPAASKPMSRKPMKRSKARGRTNYAKSYAERVVTCEVCRVLDDWHWEAFLEKDGRACTSDSPKHCHHIWTPRRWEDAAGTNLVVCCEASHAYLHKHRNYGRLICAWVKIEGGNFDREKIQRHWGRDPIASIENNIKNGEMGVPYYGVVEPFWLLVSGSNV